jgi:hypothetical protein
MLGILFFGGPSMTVLYVVGQVGDIGIICPCLQQKDVGVGIFGQSGRDH